MQALSFVSTDNHAPARPIDLAVRRLGAPADEELGNRYVQDTCDPTEGCDRRACEAPLDLRDETRGDARSSSKSFKGQSCPMAQGSNLAAEFEGFRVMFSARNRTTCCSHVLFPWLACHSRAHTHTHAARVDTRAGTLEALYLPLQPRESRSRSGRLPGACEALAGEPAAMYRASKCRSCERRWRISLEAPLLNRRERLDRS